MSHMHSESPRRQNGAPQCGLDENIFLDACIGPEVNYEVNDSYPPTTLDAFEPHFFDSYEFLVDAVSP